MYFNISNFKNILVFFGLTVSLHTLGQKPRFKDKKVATQLQNHIEYFTSEELEGRKMTTAGEYKSAQYIASQFEQIGLEPKGDEGYMQYLPIPNLRMAQAASSLKMDKEVLTLFTDFYPVSVSANNGQYRGDAINVGYGINDPGLNVNDYKDKDVKGKAVIINLDIPGGMKEHNRFMAWEGIEMRVEYAKSKGARVVLFHTTNKDLKPSGKLEMTIKHIGIPVVFVNKELTKLKAVKIDFQLSILLLSTNAHNVVGMINNKAPHTIILGAHHDHIGMGASNKEQLHPGADNNASGTAALIELAREISSKHKKYKNYNYVFVAFTASDAVISGSDFFIDSEPFYNIEPNCMINLDMLGRLDSTLKTLTLNGVGTSAGWQSAMTSTRICKRKIKYVNSTYSGVSSTDHFSFYRNGVPAIHVTTGYHNDMNTPRDNITAINYGGEAFAVRYLTKLLKKLDKAPQQQFIKTASEMELYRDLQVSLGLFPDYLYTGQGLKIAAIESNGIADKIGLKHGDIITQLGDQKIENLGEYMEKLSTFSPGTLTQIKIVRNNETKTIPLQF